jgi:hypothetical protein
MNPADILNITNLVFAGGSQPRITNATPFYGAVIFDYSLASYFMTKLDLQYEPFHNVLLTGGINYVNIKYPMDWLGIEDDVSDLSGETDYRLGFGLSVGYFSVIGPIAFGLSWDSQRQDFIGNLNIGFYF